MFLCLIKVLVSGMVSERKDVLRVVGPVYLEEPFEIKFRAFYTELIPTSSGLVVQGEDGLADGG